MKSKDEMLKLLDTLDSAMAAVQEGYQVEFDGEVAEVLWREIESDLGRLLDAVDNEPLAYAWCSVIRAKLKALRTMVEADEC